MMTDIVTARRPRPHHMASAARLIRVRAAILAAALSMSLAGCISFGSEPPPSLLTLTPTTQAPAGLGASGRMSGAIFVGELEAPAKLSLLRLPVQIDDANIAYLKDAFWVEQPSRLFRRLLGETIRAQSGRLVVDSNEGMAVPQDAVRGTLREFGYDARSQSVIVRFDAVRSGAGETVQTRRFESVIPGIKAEAGPVGVAINRAANDVAVQVAEWVG